MPRSVCEVQVSPANLFWVLVYMSLLRYTSRHFCKVNMMIAS